MRKTWRGVLLPTRRRLRIPSTIHNFKERVWLRQSISRSAEADGADRVFSFHEGPYMHPAGTDVNRIRRFIATNSQFFKIHRHLARQRFDSHAGTGSVFRATLRQAVPPDDAPEHRRRGAGTTARSSLSSSAWPGCARSRADCRALRRRAACRRSRRCP